MAENNQILFSFADLRTLSTAFKNAGEAMRVEKKDLSGISGKSDVLNKYIELYHSLCEAIEAYCDMAAHDAESINDVINKVELADLISSNYVHHGLLPMGPVLNTYGNEGR